MDEETRESIEYLNEVFLEYEKLVTNIGNNGLSASLLLYYRDEIQYTLGDLQSSGLDFKKYYQKLVCLDNMLRVNAQRHVDEVGYKNFKQYQIVNDPPREHWWWYLNVTSRAPIEKKEWKFWKKGEGKK